MKTFVCIACEKRKPIAKFYEDKLVKRGHKGTCRDCYNNRNAKERAKTKSLKCAVPFCDNGQLARTYCSMHYARWRATGDPGPAIRVDLNYKREQQRCITPGCLEIAYCRRRCKPHYEEIQRKSRPLCRVSECVSRAVSLKTGYCHKHHAQWRRCGDPTGTTRKPLAENCLAGNCDRPVVTCGYCWNHYQRFYKFGDANFVTKHALTMKERRENGWRDDKGYRFVFAPGHSEATRSKDWAAEHRKVMADHLGRALRKNENVHHINGNRSDNRIENLELWVKTQPCGQRPQDLLAWAREIIATYSAEFENEFDPSGREDGSLSRRLEEARNGH